jgi:hypothetical protein
MKRAAQIWYEKQPENYGSGAYILPEEWQIEAMEEYAKQFIKNKDNNMKKHELLKGAYDNYKAGITFKCIDALEPIKSSGVYEISDMGRVIDPINNACVWDGEWAEIIPEKTERKFILKSEDGVNLYDGDEYCSVWLESKRWTFNGMHRLDTSKAVVCFPKECKAFSTRETAQAWIKEQNKPKQLLVLMDIQGSSAIVRCDSVSFKHNEEFQFSLSSSEMDALIKAYQSLQQS